MSSQYYLVIAWRLRLPAEISFLPTVECALGLIVGGIVQIVPVNCHCWLYKKTVSCWRKHAVYVWNIRLHIKISGMIM